MIRQNSQRAGMGRRIRENQAGQANRPGRCCTGGGHDREGERAISRQRIGRIRNALGLGDGFGGGGFDADADVAIGFRATDLIGIALGFQTAR